MRINQLKFLILLFLSSSVQLYAQDNTDETGGLFVQDQLKLIAANFEFTEGASADKEGNVFFTDQPVNKIWKYGTDGKVSLFLDNAGRANGTYFDRKGNLITCADEHGEIWSVDPAGKVKVIFKNSPGKQLNGPNDIWIDSKGGMYITDPYYQRSYWTRTTPDLKSEDVYYLPRGSKTLKKVADSLQQPNGIVGTPDGKYLYVADIRARKVYKYSIKKDGSLSNRQLLINNGSDGMMLDEKGNIYLTGDGVNIYNPEGKKIAHIKVPGPSNLCFAGKEKNILFITARKSIYTLPMTVKGVE